MIICTSHPPQKWPKELSSHLPPPYLQSINACSPYTTPTHDACSPHADVAGFLTQSLMHVKSTIKILSSHNRVTSGGVCKGRYYMGPNKPLLPLSLCEFTHHLSRVNLSQKMVQSLPHAPAKAHKTHSYTPSLVH